jgi:hypothetical protein
LGHPLLMSRATPSWILVGILGLGFQFAITQHVW